MRGKNGLCAVLCLPRFILWENLELECWSQWNWFEMLIGTQRDLGPVQSRCDCRKPRWYNCVVPIGIEIPWPEWQTFILESPGFHLEAIKHLRIYYDWTSCCLTASGQRSENTQWLLLWRSQMWLGSSSQKAPPSRAESTTVTFAQGSSIHSFPSKFHASWWRWGASYPQYWNHSDDLWCVLFALAHSPNQKCISGLAF